MSETAAALPLRLSSWLTKSEFNEELQDVWATVSPRLGTAQSAIDDWRDEISGEATSENSV